MSRKTADFIVIHSAATKPSMDIGTDEINKWHRARGFLKCGYHFVIRRDGTIEDEADGCRGLMEAGAHARGYNHKSIGICMVGGMAQDSSDPENNFTDEQWEALRELVARLLEQFPNASVIGHNEISSKACPCFDVQEWWADLTD